MDWSDERYVRLYTRDTPSWTIWRWEARALLPLLLRKVDRAGVLELGVHGVRGLAALVLLPLQVVEQGLEELLADGCVVRVEGRLLVRNFQQAQEVAITDAARKRASREARRASFATNESRPVTTRHDPSQSVTPICAVPIRAEPSLEDRIDDLQPDQPLRLSPPRLPGLEPAAPEPVTREQAQALIAEHSGGLYIVSKPSRGGMFKLDKARKTDMEACARAPDAVRGWLFSRIGRWLAAGGDWRTAKGQKLDGRNLGDLDAWIAQAQAWDGRPIERNGHGRPPEIHMHETSRRKLAVAFGETEEP